MSKNRGGRNRVRVGRLSSKTLSILKQIVSETDLESKEEREAYADLNSLLSKFAHESARRAPQRQSATKRTVAVP